MQPRKLFRDFLPDLLRVNGAEAEARAPQKPLAGERPLGNLEAPAQGRGHRPPRPREARGARSLEPEEAPGWFQVTEGRSPEPLLCPVPFRVSPAPPEG